MFGIIVIGATTRRRVDGGSLFAGVYSSVYIDMLSFGLGYAIGSNGSKTTKK